MKIENGAELARAIRTIDSKEDGRAYRGNPNIDVWPTATLNAAIDDYIDRRVEAVLEKRSLAALKARGAWPAHSPPPKCAAEWMPSPIADPPSPLDVLRQAVSWWKGPLTEADFPTPKWVALARQVIEAAEKQ